MSFDNESIANYVNDDNFEIEDKQQIVEPKIENPSNETSNNDTFFETDNQQEEAKSHEKINLLNRLSRLSRNDKLGNIKFSENMTLKELQLVDKQATHLGRAEIWIKMMQRAIIFIARGAEYISEKYPNDYIDLKGYSAFLKSGIDSYVDILYDIYEYHSEVFTSSTPIFTLAIALFSNAAMYSVHRKMIKGETKRKSPSPMQFQEEEEEEEEEQEDFEEEPEEEDENLEDDRRIEQVEEAEEEEEEEKQAPAIPLELPVMNKTLKRRFSSPLAKINELLKRPEKKLKHDPIKDGLINNEMNINLDSSSVSSND